MFKNNAQRLFEKNLSVIPLMPGQKRPAVKEWSVFSSRLPTQEEIDKWSSKDGFNIGLVCGQASKIIAIDIDKEESIHKCPPSPVAKKGKKGLTRFFKYNGEVNIKRHDLGIELLSDGCQTVLPPSLHPDGMQYQWVGESLESFDINELPSLPYEFLKNIRVTVVGSKAAGRHIALTGIVYSMLSRNEELTNILKEIIDFDNKNHAIPYFTDKSEGHKGAGQLAALEMIASCAKTVINRGSEVDLIGQVTPSEHLFDEEQNKKAKSAALTSIKFPETSCKIINDMVQDILRRSNKPRYNFALASTMSLFGTVLSNKVMSKDTSPNLYQLIIANSGEGKNVPTWTPQKTLFEVGLDNLAGLSDYRSDASVVNMFDQRRERIDTLDEVSKIFRQMGGGPEYSAALPEILTKLWDSSISFFPGITTKGEGTYGALFNPCLSILGGTTPSSFVSTFSSDLMLQGFGARFIFIVDLNEVDFHETDNIALGLSDPLREWLIDWGFRPIRTSKYQLKIPIKKVDQESSKRNLIDVYTVERPNPVELPVNMDASDLFNQYGKMFSDTAKHKDESVISMYHRAIQQARKIAIIHACASSPLGNPSPVIKKEDAQFAIDYVTAALNGAEKLIPKIKFPTDYKKNVDYIFSFLKRKGKATGKEMSEAINHIPAIARKKLLQELQGLGKIIITEEQGRTKPTTYYQYNWQSEIDSH